jgi:uncharacterized protein (TIGR02271 family)
MQHSLIAVFDNKRDAQHAMNELLALGYSHADVSVSSANATGLINSLRGSAGGTAADAPDTGVGASVMHFFSELLGDEDEHVSNYAAALTGGHHVLIVTMQSEPEVERAADVVERYGPVDIDELFGLANSGSSMSNSAAGGSSLGSLMESSSMQRDVSEQLNYQRSTAIPLVDEEFRVSKGGVQLGGVRVFSIVIETPFNQSVELREEHVSVERRRVDQPIVTFTEQSIEPSETGEEAVVQKSARIVEEVQIGKEATQRQEAITDTVRDTEVQVAQLGGAALSDDSYYRAHFSRTYGATEGSYDDYALAYSYGTQMRSDARYQGRQWDNVESDLRTNWESRNGGASDSTWKKMKSAVRHGWDKLAHSPHPLASDDFKHLEEDDIFPLWVFGFQEAIDGALARMKRTQRQAVLVQSVADMMCNREGWQVLEKCGIPLVSVANSHTYSRDVSPELLGDTVFALEDRAFGLQAIYTVTPPALDDGVQLGKAHGRNEVTYDVTDEEKQKFLDDFYANSSYDDGIR